MTPSRILEFAISELWTLSQQPHDKKPRRKPTPLLFTLMILAASYYGGHHGARKVVVDDIQPKMEAFDQRLTNIQTYLLTGQWPQIHPASFEPMGPPTPTPAAKRRKRTVDNRNSDLGGTIDSGGVIDSAHAEDRHNGEDVP